MTDLTVKYFSSGMTGAPQIANNWGDLVTMLDACLINGFALKAIDTLTFADGIATATISSGHAYRPFQVIEIAGAEQPELAERFVLGFGSHAAGIDHDQVSILFALDRRVAGGLKQGGDRFGIADVHLASVGVENKAHGSQGFAVLEVSAGSALPEKPSVIFSMMLT